MINSKSAILKQTFRYTFYCIKIMKFHEKTLQKFSRDSSIFSEQLIKRTKKKPLFLFILFGLDFCCINRMANIFFVLLQRANQKAKS